MGDLVPDHHPDAPEAQGLRLLLAEERGLQDPSRERCGATRGLCGALSLPMPHSRLSGGKDRAPKVLDPVDEAHTILGCLGESPRCPLPPPNAFLRDTAGCPSQGWWVRPTSGTGSTCSLLEVRLAAPEGGVGLLVACPLGLGRRRGCEPTDLVSVWGVERIYHSCPDDPV